MNKNDSELFEKMHIAGKLAAKTLDELTPFVKPGVTTNFLDKICYEYIKEQKKVIKTLRKALKLK